MALVDNEGNVIGSAWVRHEGGDGLRSESWAKILLDYCAGAVSSEEGFSTDRLYNLAEAYGAAKQREGDGPVGLNATPEPLEDWRNVEVGGVPVVGVVDRKMREKELGDKLLKGLMDLVALSNEEDVRRVVLDLKDTVEMVDGTPMKELVVSLVFEDGGKDYAVRGAVRL